MDVELIREPYERAFEVNPLAALKVLWAYRKGEIGVDEAVRLLRRIYCS
jgi:hypothetical protein